MAEVGEKRKRQRLQPTHRWADAETADLLNTILEKVKDNPESLEKPTAQMFYSNIAAKTPSIEAVNWTLMKSKLRNLKTSYLSSSFPSISGRRVVSDTYSDTTRLLGVLSAVHAAQLAWPLTRKMTDSRSHFPGCLQVLAA